MINSGLGRFGLKNPLKQPSRGLDIRTTGTPMFTPHATAGFTTTNTTDYLYAFSNNIVTFGSHFTALEVNYNVRFRHSSVPASFDLAVFVDFGNATGSGNYFLFLPALLISSTTLWNNFAGTISQDLGDFAIAPGTLHTIGVVVRNNTAGTLEMANPTSQDQDCYLRTKEVSWKLVS